jgi:hypothetical protein
MFGWDCGTGGISGLMIGELGGGGVNRREIGGGARV